MQISTSRFRDKWRITFNRWYHFSIGFEIVRGQVNISLFRYGIHVEWK